MKLALVAASIFVAATASARSVTVATPTDLATAVANAQPGDVITLLDGSYQLAAPLVAAAAGTVAAPIRVTAAHSPHGATIVAAGGAVDGVRVSGPYWTFDGVDFSGGSFGVHVVNGAIGTTVRRARFVDNAVAGLRADCGGPDPQTHCDSGVVDGIEATRIALTNACAWAAVEIAGGAGWVVENVLVHDVGNDTLGCPTSTRVGVALRANAQNVTVRDVIVRDTDSGIAVGAPTTDACQIRGATNNGNGTCTAPTPNCAVQTSLVANALVYDTAVDGILATSPCAVRVHGATLWNTGVGTARSIDGAGTGTLDVSDVILDVAMTPGTVTVGGDGNLTLPAPADASWFLDAAHGNFRLLAGTPPVDHGVTLADLTSDLDGIARPQGAAYDVGAYERPPGGYPDGGVPIVDMGSRDGGGGSSVGPGVGGGQPQPVPGSCHCDLGGVGSVGVVELLLAIGVGLALLLRRRRG